MSVRNSLLIAGLYATIGLFVVIIASGTFTYYRSVSAGAVARREASQTAEMAAYGGRAAMQPPQAAGQCRGPHTRACSAE